MIQSTTPTPILVLSVSGTKVLHVYICSFIVDGPLLPPLKTDETIDDLEVTDRVSSEDYLLTTYLLMTDFPLNSRYFFSMSPYSPITHTHVHARAWIKLYPTSPFRSDSSTENSLRVSSPPSFDVSIDFRVSRTVFFSFTFLGLHPCTTVQSRRHSSGHIDVISLLSLHYHPPLSHPSSTSRTIWYQSRNRNYLCGAGEKDTDCDLLYT